MRNVLLTTAALLGLAFAQAPADPTIRSASDVPGVETSYRLASDVTGVEVGYRVATLQVQDRTRAAEPGENTADGGNAIGTETNYRTADGSNASGTETSYRTADGANATGTDNGRLV